MGTNYYLHDKAPCATCGHAEEPKHIGKSSYGWRFSLHVIPDKGINSLDDWRALWGEHGAEIRDEYGEVIPIPEMEKEITDRQGFNDRPLSFHDIDGHHCIGHGPGTYDFITGWFS